VFVEVLVRIKVIIVSGASFCQVDNIKQDTHEIEVMTHD